VVAMLGVSAACRVDVDVDRRADRTGGVELAVAVTLDAAALVQVPDLAAQLRVADLRDAGWRVDGPSPTPGGGAVVRAARTFATPAGLARAVRELSGPTGPFASLRLHQSRSLVGTSTRLSGRVDLAAGLAAYSDPDLQQRLGGLPLGVDLAALERELGQPLAEVFDVEFTARLPGRTTEVQAPLGQVTPVAVSADRVDVSRLSLVGTSLISALALVVVLVRRRRGR
ncbi:MAG: hypothetical protein ACRDZW_04980, partial [Acidimicrobiales bacterium]